MSRLILLLAVISLALSGEEVKAQSPSGESPDVGVVLTKLYGPIYPPLSRQARIAGDVQVRLGIRRDGTIASAEAVSGHAMLKPAALESAQKSTFECRGCTQEITFYTLTYTFGFNSDSNCSLKRSRSVKCLYLWSCGYWRRVYNDMPGPSVTRSRDHITILTGSLCWEA